VPVSQLVAACVVEAVEVRLGADVEALGAVADDTEPLAQAELHSAERVRAQPQRLLGQGKRERIVNPSHAGHDELGASDGGQAPLQRVKERSPCLRCGPTGQRAGA
jgi:hypothetical protein